MIKDIWGEGVKFWNERVLIKKMKTCARILTHLIMRLMHFDSEESKPNAVNYTEIVLHTLFIIFCDELW